MAYVPDPPRARSRRRARRPACVLGVALILHALALPGCVRYRPQPLDGAAFWDRVQVQERAGVRLTAAALGPRESSDLFGVDLARHGIQPVWLQIENGGDRRYVFLQHFVWFEHDETDAHEPP